MDIELGLDGDAEGLGGVFGTAAEPCEGWNACPCEADCEQRIIASCPPDSRSTEAVPVIE